jgi:hypothetical protein
VTAGARIPPETKKTGRLTVLLTEAEMDKLNRVAAFHNLPKSVMANQLIMLGLADAPGMDDAGLADAETRQETWRERMGL